MAIGAGIVQQTAVTQAAARAARTNDGLRMDFRQRNGAAMSANAVIGREGAVKTEGHGSSHEISACSRKPHDTQSPWALVPSDARSGYICPRECQLLALFPLNYRQGKGLAYAWREVCQVRKSNTDLPFDRISHAALLWKLVYHEQAPCVAGFLPWRASLGIVR